jgi:HPt (histidine-containing phosphotransfer) domain-containing protein
MVEPTDNEEEKIIVRVDPDLEDLVPRFLQNRENDIQLILDALSRNDYETVRILAHSMKGAGSGYGFEGITKIGGALEQAAKNQNSQEVRRRVSELSNYLKRLVVVSQ